MHDLGTLGGQFSFGKHINNAGWVAGDSSKSGDSRTQTHAFVWDGSLHDVGTLGGSRSVANGINASGQVIGFANTANNAAEHAFLWEDGKLYDLNDLIDPKDPLRDVTLTRAHDINDLGQIVATGVQSGKFRSFILSPTDYRIHGFFFPVSSPQWKLGRTVTVQVALADVVNGKLVRDGEAVALLTAPCRVKFSVSGAQTRVARCMTYDRATNRFSHNWAIEKTGAGRATIAVDVSYLGTSTTMIRKSRNITITE